MGGNPEAGQEAIGPIRRLAQRYWDTGMVLNTWRGIWQHRPTNVRPDFSILETVSLGPEQIESFVRSWFDQEPEKADVLLAALNRNLYANQLASNPLLLTLMVIRYDESDALPAHDRYSILHDAVELLLEKWDRDPSRRAKRRPILRHSSMMRTLLSELALSLHASRNWFTARVEVERLVTDFLEKRPQFDSIQAADVIDHDLETTYGLIRSLAVGQYGFLHLSLQEFFTAKAIDGYYWDDWWQSGRLLSHVGDPWWNEVFIHLGSGNHAETLITALLDGQDDLFHTRLLLAGRCLAGVGLVNRSVQHRVMDGLFGLLDLPTEAGSHSHPEVGS